jgi:hypothetical protein
MFKIIQTRWGLFTALSGVIYLYHLTWTIAGVNAFADYTRKNICGSITGTGSVAADEASAIFDTALALSTVYHMIEWLRWTLFATTALVGADLLTLFKIFSINIPFGVVTFIIALATRYGTDGAACAVENLQETRGSFLSLQVVCLVLFLPLSFGHILFMKVMGNEWCHTQWLYEEPEEVEEE